MQPKPEPKLMDQLASTMSLRHCSPERMKNTRIGSNSSSLVQISDFDGMYKDKMLAVWRTADSLQELGGE